MTRKAGDDFFFTSTWLAGVFCETENPLKFLDPLLCLMLVLGNIMLPRTRQLNRMIINSPEINNLSIPKSDSMQSVTMDQ